MMTLIGIGWQNHHIINAEILPIVPGATGIFPMNKNVLINNANEFIYRIKYETVVFHYYNNNEFPCIE